MKYVFPLIISMILLCGCAANSDAASSTESRAETTATEDPFAEHSEDASQNYDPFAEDSSDGEEELGAFSCGVEWEPGRECVLDYAPTVTFPYYIENNAGRTDFGLLIFVNGFRQPYRTDSEPEDAVLHSFSVDEDERLHPKISFEPVVGEMGETLTVEIVSMFHPGFVLTDKTIHAALNFNHRILSLFPSSMTVTEQIGLRPPKVCTDYTEIPITAELRDAYTEQSGNQLDRLFFLEALKNDALITPRDRLTQSVPKTVFRGGDALTLCVYGGGRPYTYRVSMYLDHALVPGVFDGCDYIDMTPSADTMCKKEIDTSLLPLKDEWSHLYFIAVPIYTDTDYANRRVEKSESAAIIGIPS